MSLIEKVKAGKCYRTKEMDIDGIGKVSIRELLSCEVEELATYQDKIKAKELKEVDFLFKIISLAVLDENGEPAFNDSDIEQLRKIPLDIANTISDEVLKLSGLNSEEPEKN